MFEHIHFLSWNHQNLPFTTTDVTNHENYTKFAQKYADILPHKNEYQIQGSTHFLLQRPCPDYLQKYLNHIQAFCYMEMGKDYYTKRQDYHSFLLLFTYCGRGHLSLHQQEYELTPGDLAVIDCRDRHEYYTKESIWRHSDLHIQGDWIKIFYHEYFLEHSPVIHLPHTQSYQQHLEHILRLQTGSCPDWAFRVSCELEHLFLFICDQRNDITAAGQIPDSISSLRTYLEHNFQQNLSLDELASFCGLSKYHLCREYRRYTGFSPKEYVIKLRISHAKLLLETTDLPCAKISLLSGFTSETNFIRQFQKNTGTTPGAWRKNILKTAKN